jgi:hypothetical protein
MDRKWRSQIIRQIRTIRRKKKHIRRQKDMTMKKRYTVPQIEEIQINTITLLTLSGGEQTEVGVFTDKEKDASNALANPFRGRGF